MPELPEVETVCRGLAPHLVGETVTAVLVREHRLRWPIDDGLAQAVTGQSVIAVSRRAKYLLIRLDRGHLMIHLGMSGSMRVSDTSVQVRKHDHVDLVLGSGVIVRFHDPRRFGSMFYFEHPPSEHALLSRLGPEPLSDVFGGDHLFHMSRKRSAAVKTFIMDSHVVVGVGNIYASEALFAAGIRPDRAAGRIAKKRYATLAAEIKIVLSKAIAEGGTTLRDFAREDGSPGYFTQSLAVYGRAGEACVRCGSAIREMRIGQRNSFYCARCQR